MIEYKLLIGNIEEMIAVHKTLESSLEEESPSKKSPREQRLGKVLLANGIAIKAVHLILNFFIAVLIIISTIIIILPAPG